MKLNIDLGMGGEEIATPAVLSKPSEKYYPSITYSGSKEMVLPEEGEMTVSYRKKRSSSTTNDDGKTTYDCTIEIREILSVEGESEPTAPASNRHQDANSALDALVANYKKSKKAY